MTAELSTVAKLSRIIQAMLQGGWIPPEMEDQVFTFDRCRVEIDNKGVERPNLWCIHLEETDDSPDEGWKPREEWIWRSTLDVLLEPAALKAAFGADEQFYSFDGVHVTGERFWRGKWVARCILNAWIDGGPAEAVDKAFSLLAQ